MWRTLIRECVTNAARQPRFRLSSAHPLPLGNLLKVTAGPHAGKLCLLDFGLVAEVPQRDRDSMVSATIHLANRDWPSLIDDFVALDFLPPDCDRGVIIPVMDRVLSPYLSGGGAKAFNFQALSQDLLRTTLEIPFSVPPYMSLLARSVATLEGIALLGDPNYQMVAQVRREWRRGCPGDRSSACPLPTLTLLLHSLSGLPFRRAQSAAQLVRRQSRVPAARHRVRLINWRCQAHPPLRPAQRGVGLCG